MESRRLFYSRRLRISAIAGAYMVSAAICFFLPELAGWTGRIVLAFFLPTMMVGICVLVGQLASITQIRPVYLRFHDTFELTLNAVTVFVVGLHIILLWTLLLGPSRWMWRVLFLLIGALLIAGGAILRHVRPDPAAAICAPWNFRQERSWLVAHRVAGYLLVASGAVIVAGTLLAPWRLRQLFLIVVAAGLISFGALSWWIWLSFRNPEKR